MTNKNCNFGPASYCAHTGFVAILKGWSVSSGAGKLLQNILTSLFLIILANNFLGLFPYIFTRTRHLTLTLTLALPLWITFILHGWIKNTNHIFEHLVPQGTPTIYFGLFQVKVQLVSKWMMDYIVICFLDCWFWYWHEIGFGCNDL
jgi:F0F1-type ATP synthase membrane subunit a